MAWLALMGGAAFLAMALAEIGVPQMLVQSVSALSVDSFVLLLVLMLSCLALGSVLDGISTMHLAFWFCFVLDTICKTYETD